MGQGVKPLGSWLVRDLNSMSKMGLSFSHLSVCFLSIGERKGQGDNNIREEWIQI